MGIELPVELRDVAARTGVRWPVADEDRMRESAAAWRQAATSIGRLAADSDFSAEGALSAMSGGAAHAARRQWNGFVAPDSGRFMVSVKECTAAADRLEHAAEQIGAAKVRMVRELVNLAKATDATERAAAAGSAQALAGVHTAISAASTNLARVHADLARTVQSHAGEPHGGARGGGATAQSSTVEEPFLGQAGDRRATRLGVTDLESEPGEVGHRGDTRDLGNAGDLGNPGDRHGSIEQRPAPGAAGNGAIGGLGGAAGTAGSARIAGNAERTGPVGADTIAAADTGPLPAAGSASGFADDPAAAGTSPATAPQATHQAWAAPAAPPVDASPAASGGPVGSPTAGPGNAPSPGSAASGGYFAPPVVAGDGQPAGAPGVAAPGNPGGAGGVAGPGAGGPLGGSAAQPRSPAVPAGPYGPPAQPGPAPAGQAPAAQPGYPPLRGGYQPGVVGAGPAKPGPVAPGQPGAPHPAGPHEAAQRPLRQAGRNSAVLAFVLHQFPIGYLPVAAASASRQLPAPPPDLDRAAGLRFPPQDHPHAELVDDTGALSRVHSGEANAKSEPGSRRRTPWGPDQDEASANGTDHSEADHSDADQSEADQRAELVAGHDPLGGELSESEWQRRYVARAAVDGLRTEYVWPPWEQYPEGGLEAGLATVLPPDTVIDRFGEGSGRVLAPGKTSFRRRSLPPEHLDRPYRRYRVVCPLPVWQTTSCPWFEQPGGGTRYRVTYPVDDLVVMGYLVEIQDAGEPAGCERPETGPSAAGLCGGAPADAGTSSAGTSSAGTSEVEPAETQRSDPQRSGTEEDER